ncbi:hypothetical protein [Caldivirga sp.]|uniref:hypothetical protein n=1 Tax=Caldivirga sp. TaxID=2080243 RepID=UPI003D14B39D
MVYKGFVEELKEKYGIGDPRILSIKSTFEEWGMEMPPRLLGLINQYQGQARESREVGLD